MQNKKNCTVSIDTSGIREARVTIADSEGNAVGSFFMEGKSQTILPTLEKALAETGRTPDDIVGILVNTGPGSFTGVRVGVAVAKVLGLLLGVHVNGKDPWVSTAILYEKDKFDHSPLQG